MLQLNDDERSAISGSWDKTVLEWDLEHVSTIRKFTDGTGQISSIEWQPVGGSLIPEKMAQESLLSYDSTSLRSLDKSNKQTNGSVGGGSDDDDDDKSLDSLFGDEDEEEDDASNKNKPEESVINANPTNGTLSEKPSKPEDSRVGSTNKPSNDEAKEKDDTSSGEKKNNISKSVFLTSSINGTIDIWDRRQEKRVAHIKVPERTPPWATSACWSTDGEFIYVGRRNSCVEEFNIKTSLSSPTRTFRFPTVSGAVSAVKPMPSGRHLLCASYDNIRLYDLKASTESTGPTINNKGSLNDANGGALTPFYIIPGHHGGIISQIFIDPGCQYMITTSGHRGWLGNSTDLALIYDINAIP